MKNSKAQLLLLAIAILAVALILIATSTTVLLNIKREQAKELVENLGNELKELKLNFGYALEDELSNKRNALNKAVSETNNLIVKQEMSASISNVSLQFEYFQALKGRIFNASWDQESFQANNSYKNISFNVTFVLSSQNFEFKEEVGYWFRYNDTTERYEVRMQWKKLE